MIHDYPNLTLVKKSIFVKFSIVLLRTLNRFRLIPMLTFDDEAKTGYYHSIILKRKTLYCKGWLFRSYDTTLKYRSFYQKMFDPDIDKQFFQEKYLKRSHEDQIIIGVHIRRGDYKSYSGGIYYYDDITYIEKTKQLISVLNRDYKILIFSNDDDLNHEEYNQKLKNVIISKNSAIADHFLMSKCDYIIGPPSTFSLWASYIGESPYYHIKNTKDKITLSEFEICNG